MPASEPEQSSPLPYLVRELGFFPPGAIDGWFTRREKLGRAVWGVVHATLFRLSPKRADRFRGALLRLFGARVHGRPSIIRRTVQIEVPWNVELGEGVQIGDGVKLYSLGPISIGPGTVISQYSHICAGTHDYSDLKFPLRRVPITIGSQCWIATEVYVAPGVTVGDGAVVGARSVVVKDVPAWTVSVGNPARQVGKRYLQDRQSGRRLDPHGVGE